MPPAYPAVCLLFLPPSPRPPSRREGGEYYFISPGATAPGTPALNRLRHLQFLPSMSPAGGLPSLLPACPAFSFVSCPHPPPPFPSGEGGALRLFYARGFAPCIPGAGREAALAFLVENGFLWLSQRCKGIQSLAGWDAALVNSAASQGEGGPGEMELSVASDGGV